MTFSALRDLVEDLRDARPTLWAGRSESARSTHSIDAAQVQQAVQRFERFAPLLAQLFPELQASGGRIESALLHVPQMQQALQLPEQLGRLWLKADHSLPVAGSIKARGGVHEVLEYAEQIALQHGLLADGDYLQLASDAARAVFARYQVAVGSTGNLGLSIGVMASGLGFKATVHMSADAKEWKKQRLRARGVAIVYISHRLEELQRVAQRIVVLRDGKLVCDEPIQRYSSAELVNLMVGRELPTPQTHESTVTDVVEIRLVDLTLDSVEGRRLLDTISFDIHRGEVLGIAGVEGNGQNELVEAIMGIRTPTSGRIELAGRDITSLSTRARREACIAYIPEDRIRHGLLMEAPLWENRILGHQTKPPNVRGPFIDRAGARADTERIVREYDVRTPSIDVLASSLSGGNQQKLIVGREMSGDPTVLIASHPTRGVDVGAQAAIWDLLRAARREGLAVLLISADLDELIGLSDTIQVILRGRLVATADPMTVTPEELGSAMTGAS